MERRRKIKHPQRIDWTDPMNLIPLEVAVHECPFHAKVLAKMTGLSTGQVYYRLKQHGISLTSVRNGLTGIGKDVVERYQAKNVNAKVISKMKDTHDELMNGKKKRSA